MWTASVAILLALVVVFALTTYCLFAVGFAAMALTRKRKRGSSPSYARLDAFTRGVIWGLALVGTPREQMRKLVVKPDGTAPSPSAIDDVIAKKKEHPEWHGEEEHSGRPKSLSAAQQKQLVDLVFAERGRSKVTVKFCKMRLRFLRKNGRHVVERALQEAGLRWLRRRPKTLVPKLGKEMRMEYACWLRSRRPATLARFAYTDGTTFYLARRLRGGNGERPFDRHTRMCVSQRTIAYSARIVVHNVERTHTHTHTHTHTRAHARAHAHTHAHTCTR